MPRVKRGVTAHASHKKVLDAAKGYRGRRKNVFRIANEAVMKAGQYAYRDRRQKSVSSVSCGSPVSTPPCARWIGHDLQRVHERSEESQSIEIDRKVLSDMAIFDQPAFAKIAEQAKASLGA
jgi:large subunit ribosomal protein L20